jgi:hypothetical protein
VPFKKVSRVKQQFCDAASGGEAFDHPLDFLMVGLQRLNKRGMLWMKFGYQWKDNFFLGTKMPHEIAREKIAELARYGLQALSSRGSDLTQRVLATLQSQRNPAMMIGAKEL